MLFVLGLVAAVGYMFFTKQTLEANLHEQVKEFHAQQEAAPHPVAQDSTHAEIKEIKKICTKTGKEDFNEALAPVCLEHVRPNICSKTTFPGCTTPQSSHTRAPASLDPLLL